MIADRGATVNNYVFHINQGVPEARKGEVVNEAQEVVLPEARALVHRASFLQPRSPECYFVKVVNLLQDRDIEVTHVWFDTDPPVYIFNDARPLPTRLHPNVTFETWVPVAALPDVPNMEQLGRVLLSSGQIVKSQLNENVPPVGNVGGAGSR